MSRHGTGSCDTAQDIESVRTAEHPTRMYKPMCLLRISFKFTHSFNVLITINKRDQKIRAETRTVSHKNMHWLHARTNLHHQTYCAEFMHSDAYTKSKIFYFTPATQTHSRTHAHAHAHSRTPTHTHAHTQMHALKHTCTHANILCILYSLNNFT